MGQVATQVLNAPAAATEWIDVSVPISTGMVHFPDNPPILVTAIMHLDRGDICTVSTLEMGTHTGTHIDAPSHFIRGGAGAVTVALQNLIGAARVIEIEHPSAVTYAELRDHNVRRSERLLCKTLNSQRCWNGTEFVSDFISLAEDAAQYLAELD